MPAEFPPGRADGGNSVAALYLLRVGGHGLRIAGQSGCEWVDQGDHKRALARPGFNQSKGDELFDGIPDRVAGYAVLFLKVLLGRQLTLVILRVLGEELPGLDRRRSWSAISRYMGVVMWPPSQPQRSRRVRSFHSSGPSMPSGRKICRTGLGCRSSGYVLHVPTIGMVWMAGCIGSILAVRLLGRASIYLMAPASQAIGLTITSAVVLARDREDAALRSAPGCPFRSGRMPWWPERSR